jgi:hypothetical protein
MLWMLCLWLTTARILERSCDGRRKKVGQVYSEACLCSASLVARLLGVAPRHQKNGLSALYLVSLLELAPRSRMLDLRERLRVYPRHTARSAG